MKQFGEWLFRKIARKGITQAVFARAIDCSESNLSDIVNGRRFPSTEKLKVIFDYFGCDAAEQKTALHLMFLDKGE